MLGPHKEGAAARFRTPDAMEYRQDATSNGNRNYTFRGNMKGRLL